MIKNKASAKKAIEDVNPEHAFYVCNGEVLNNLNDLLKSMKKMDNGAYEYHVNAEKNDFSNWIKDIIGDEKLAKDIYTKDKKTAISIISLRVRELKKKSK